MLTDESRRFRLEANIKATAKESLQAIMAQREEILRAFVAKYGFEPDEAMQIIQETLTGVTWQVVRVTKKEET